MKKSLIVMLLFVIGLITACQPGTIEAVAPVITEAPKPPKTLEGQYKAFSRVWSERIATTIKRHKIRHANAKGVRYPKEQSR